MAIFDGECGFCRLWIRRWNAATGSRVDYTPSQEVGRQFPEIPEEVYRRAFVLVLPDGRTFEGAEAALATLAEKPGGRGRLLAVYRRAPGFAPLADLAYRMVAAHRSAALALTRLAWGETVLPPTYLAANALFLRLLALSALAAFVSAWTQVHGLVGSRGVLPVPEYLEWVRGHTGAERYWLVPTLSWIAPGDGGLNVLCGLGVAASLALLAGFAPAWCAGAVWASYLSLSVAGQVFFEFQWDILLLETSLLAVFLASPALRRFRGGLAAPRLARFLLVWLLFRLMLSSGAVKLLSGDFSWRNLSALRVYYETQPLPPWTAWFVHRLPPAFHTASAVFLFFVELAVPFFFFAPRRLRRFACAMTILLQLLIAATGNYAFFNLLTIALALLLLDDDAFPRRWRESARAEKESRVWPRAVLVPVAAVLLAASAVPFAASLRALPRTSGPFVALYRWLAPLRSTNSYGLFAVMTTTRPEILIEGSEDGTSWRPYEFPDKPGDERRRPRFVAPHQPRLDWQMWFAALGTYRENPWLVRLVGRLLEGSPDVLGLFASNPFPERPPRFVRASLYDYRFTDSEERRRTGAWWRREPRGLYLPALTRENFAPAAP